MDLAEKGPQRVRAGRASAQPARRAPQRGWNQRIAVSFTTFEELITNSSSAISFLGSTWICAG